MTSSRHPASITFHSLSVSRFSVAAHRMSELVKSDKRGLSKLWDLHGGIDIFQRRCREQAGVAFGVMERPLYVPFKRVCVKERSVLHCFLKASRLSLNVSKLFPHTQVFKDISLKVSSSSLFTWSLLLNKIVLVSLAKQLKDPQDTIGVSSQGLSSVQRGVERDVHSAVMSHGVDSCPYFTWISIFNVHNLWASRAVYFLRRFLDADHKREGTRPFSCRAEELQCW